MFDVQALLADVRLKSARRHAVGDQVLTLKVLPAEAARIERLALGVELGVHLNVDGGAERLPAHDAGQRRRALAVLVQVRVELLLRFDTGATHRTLRRAQCFAVRQFVFGQRRRRREDVVTDVALEATGRRWRWCRARHRRRLMQGLGVRFQFQPRLARLTAVRAV